MASYLICFTFFLSCFFFQLVKQIYAGDRRRQVRSLENRSRLKDDFHVGEIPTNIFFCQDLNSEKSFSLLLLLMMNV